jgi:hypothetical protein
MEVHALDKDGQGFGIYVIDRGGDRINLIEAFWARKRHSFGFAQDKFAISHLHNNSSFSQRFPNNLCPDHYQLGK